MPEQLSDTITSNIEIQQAKAILDNDLLEKLFHKEANLIDGITANFSANDLQNTYNQILDFYLKFDEDVFRSSLSDSEKDKIRDDLRLFKLSTENFILNDFSKTHNFSTTLETYKELGRLDEYKTVILRDDILGRLANRLNTSNPSEISRYLNDLSLANKLDLFFNFSSHPNLSDNTYEIISEQIRLNSDSPFTDFIVRYCQELINEVKTQNSSRSFNFYLIQNTFQKAKNNSHQQDYEITNLFLPSSTMNEGEMVVNIASDAVALVDQEGKPISYSHLIPQKIIKPNIELNSLDGYIALFSPLDRYYGHPKNFSVTENMDYDSGTFDDQTYIFNNLDDLICSYYKIDNNDLDKRCEAWHNISPVLSVDGWKDLFNKFNDFFEDKNKNQFIEIYDLEYIDLVNMINKTLNPEFTKNIRDWMEKIRPEIEESIPKVEFTSYENLDKDPEINPFGLEQKDLSTYFSFLHNPVFQLKIKDEIGIDLTEIDLGAQVNLLKFLVSTDQETYDQFKSIFMGKGNIKNQNQKYKYENPYNPDYLNLSFSPTFRQNFLNSFLSCADDPAFGKKILNIFERYKKTDRQLNESVSISEYSTKFLQPIFSKYAEIVDATENVRTYLQENYHGQVNSDEIINDIIKNLLSKGKDLLSDFADNPREPEEVIQALENYKTETLIFASTCKALKQEGQQINLEDFAQYGVDVLPATEIAPEDQQIMMQVLVENWQNQDPDLAEYALDSLNKSFANQDSRFYILRYGGQVLGFKRFDVLQKRTANMENNDLYAGSFNINPQLRRSGIGEAAMRAYLSQEAETHTVHADASPFTPITTRYIGEFGFVGTNIKDMEYKGKTFPLLGMERNDKIIDQYRFVSAPYGEIAKNYRNSEPDQETGTLVILVNQENVLDQMRQSLSSGDLVLTAYRPNPDNPKEYLLAFEPKIKVENPTENVAQALV